MINSLSTEFRIQEITQIDNGVGGFIDEWTDVFTIRGFLDLLSGTDINILQAAISEHSTHILITNKYFDGINSDMRVIDNNNRYYSITYADNPAGINHHNELYLKYGGVLDV